MSSVSAVTSGVADLLRTFSKAGSSPLPSALSSTSVQSALAIASPGDLVQLSQQALALQQVGGLFGGSDSSGSSDASGATAGPGTLILQALASQGQTSQSQIASSPAASPATSETLAQQEAAVLFGTNSVTGSGNSTISLLG